MYTVTLFFSGSAGAAGAAELLGGAAGLLLFTVDLDDAALELGALD